MQQRSDKSIAYRVLCLIPGLPENARRVGGYLIDHYNLRTKRCDPGIRGLAKRCLISERTVIRAINELESAGLVTKVRHGGTMNKNSYSPNWARFAALDQSFDVKAVKATARDRQSASPSTCQDWHSDGDRTVVQTPEGNHFQETRSSGPAPEPKLLTPLKNGSRQFVSKRQGKPSRDAARDEAEKRWNQEFASRLLPYSDLYQTSVAAIDEAMKDEATAAEMSKKGSGIHVVIRRLSEVITDFRSSAPAELIEGERAKSEPPGGGVNL